MWQCKKCREKSEDSFDLCWNCGTSKEGEEDPSFQKADAEEASVGNAPAADDRSPSSSAGITRCPGCSSSTLDYGAMGADVRFFRSKQWISTGWAIQAFVCLDCGLLTQYLDAGDLEQLRARNAKPGATDTTE